MANEKIHVMPHPDGGWQVKREGGDKAVAIFKTKKEAMTKARSMSGRSDSHVIEHGEDGKVMNVSKSAKVDTDMKNVKVHVMPNPKGGWQVKREGSDKIIGTYDTKEEAMERGRALCGNSDSHLVEHSSKGTIQSVTKSKKQETSKKKVVVTNGKIVIKKGSTAEVKTTATGKTVVVIKEKKPTAKKTCAKKTEKKPEKKPAEKKPETKKAAAKPKQPKTTDENGKKKRVIITKGQVIVRGNKKAKVEKTSTGKNVIKKY